MVEQVRSLAGGIVIAVAPPARSERGFYWDRQLSCRMASRMKEVSIDV
jgi:hypothetical protein